MLALRILLVDDDLMTLHALARLLRGAGFAVHATGTREDALEIMANEPIDLLIADLGLNAFHGNELMRRIAEEYSIPGIALADHDKQKSRGAGFVAHLLKPIAFDRLLDAIQTASPVLVDGHCRHRALPGGSQLPGTLDERVDANPVYA